MEEDGLMALGQWFSNLFPNETLVEGEEGHLQEPSPTSATFVPLIHVL